MLQDFTARVEKESPFVIVNMAGVLEESEVPKIISLIKDLKKGDAKYLLMDLGGVSTVDSAGLGVLAQAQHLCQGLGFGYAVVQSPSTQVRRVCEITGLRKVVSIYDTREAAFEALRDKEDSPRKH